MDSFVSRSSYVVVHLYFGGCLTVYRYSHHPQRIGWRRLVSEGRINSLGLSISEDWLEKHRFILGDDGRDCERPTVIQPVCVSDDDAKTLSAWMGTSEGPHKFGDSIALRPVVMEEPCPRQAVAVALEWLDPSLLSEERIETVPAVKN